jgi:hypothetical protein
MNQLTKDKTMEEKKVFDAKKKAAAQAYQERKKEAREKINAWLNSDESKKLPKEVREAILYMAGSGVRSGRSGIVSELKELLLKGPVSAVDIFQKFEYGRPTMNQKINNFIKASPEDRIWVVFEDGNYLVKGKGPEAPRGWTGYMPAEKEEL